MELINSSASGYLPETSLENLHIDSREWLNEINFWTEEMSCFYKLLHKTISSTGFPPKELAGIEREIIRINSEDLIKLKNQVERHERELSMVLKNTSTTQEMEYRQRHQRLINDMYALHGTIRKFKKALFALVKES
jgi:hypothetical protein